MRPEKLYAVGHSAKWRTSRPVIIIQRPDPPNATVVPEHTTSSPANAITALNRRSRLWSIAKVIGPSSVAVAAIIISLLTYENQHQANQETASSSLRQQAERVSFFQQQGNGQSNGIMVDNYSETPVSDATFLGKIVFNDGHSFSVTIPLGSIPACSLGRITSSMIANYFNGTTFVHFSSSAAGAVTIDSRDIPDNNYRLTAESMYFTDNNGVDWQYPAGGPLETAKLPLIIASLSDAITALGNAITAEIQGGVAAGENSSKLLTPSYVQSTTCSD